ncbi:MarR family winged helix-turn-helix transcriptional regulator [Limnohabitans sp. TS-CS-82]|uniref:MarR family winged helix-turn-helix transcriptional regulator n=1 Tax=Limnohabitans sp. TS-CS-82 TaxID=2094193 RepID=UPI00191C08AC|nr:MarR family winged helix-turn-helix transcriptional regulator [Limnohabitans sp. TS-CS-82]
MRQAIEQLYFGYRAFTEQPDRMLEQRGLNRVHHRILYFVGRRPQLTVNTLLATLNVTKQALNAPLRQLIGMDLVEIRTAEHDKRLRLLALTAAGMQLEAQLTGTQIQQVFAAFEGAGPEAVVGWLKVMRSLSKVQSG